MSPSTYREFLAAALALQLGFVRRQALIAAISRQRSNRSAGLLDELMQHAALQPQIVPLLRELAERHVEMHGENVDHSLAALAEFGPLRDELRTLASEDVEPTLTVAARPASGPDDEERESADNSRRPMGARYRVVRPHAEGGLGKVSVALDTELNREVAFKEIQERLADDSLSRARFVLEAEITGGLEHPGIVPVYGLGTDRRGRPYYAMRFVRGDSLAETIQQFHGKSEVGSRNAELKTETTSDSESSAFRLPTSAFASVSFRQLLGRFVDVCQAVEYAHSRGVLHRDLKPGNVMLGKYGETLVVDWGLAKPLARGEDGNAAGESLLRPASSDSTSTLVGSAVGTPAYMPPEQAAGKLDELGPASDVYSLGATLYHLLTGRAPFLPSPIGRGREGEGPNAGKRLDLADLLQRVRSGDFTQPREIVANIPKALEAICLKAMATQIADRYSSPAELAEEVERYLADEPVAAHVEPFAQRARRYLRKHPRLVAGVAATILVGLAGLAAILSVVSLKNAQLSSANQQLLAANTAERAAKDEAVAKQKESDAVLGFFEKYVLAAARPEGQEGGLGVDASIREATDAAEPWIAGAFAEQPLVEASIRHSLGGTYIYLGEYSAALHQRQRAHELRETHLGSEHQQTLQALSSLAAAYHYIGDLEQAQSLYEQAIRRQTAALGPTHEETLKTMSNRAALYTSAGQPQQAQDLYEKTLTLMKEHLGAEHRYTLVAMNNLALALQAARKLDRAIALLAETIKVRTARYGAEHPDTLYSVVSLAAAYQSAGKAELALPLLEKALAGQKTRLPAEHPHTLQSMERLGNAYAEAQQPEQAEATFRELLALRRQHRPDDFKTFEMMLRLAEVLVGKRRYADAERLLLEGHEGLLERRAVLSPPERERITIAVHRLVNLYELWEKPAEADKWRRELGVHAPAREPLDAP